MKYILGRGQDHDGYSSIDFQGDLNEEQYKVVTEADGPSLVLAGAGSGKTRTLVYRVAYLLKRSVPPHNILLVTFTNKAAHTMQDRVETLLKAKPKDLWSGTFHHIGNRCIRLYAKKLGYSPDFGILDEEDSMDLIRVCIKNLKIDMSQERFPVPKVIRTIISYSLNSRSTVEKTIGALYPYFFKYYDTIRRIQREYDEKKKASNVMDYDDLLIKWLELLEHVPEAGNRFTEQFRYILVDEYQDTNKLQAAIIGKLGSVHKNILVVGDDAQSIYSFRGADVTNILNFPNDYENAKIFKLETNYRSIPEILDLANNSIVNNANQFHKKLRPIRTNMEKPALIEVSDMHAQAAFVVQRILEMRDEGIPMTEIAVLFRAHYQAAEIEMELIKRNIPYVIRGGTRFFEQAHIKDALSYLRIMVNSFDELAWIRALVIMPGIGSVYAGKIYDEFAKTGELKNILSPKFCEFLPPRSKLGLTRFKKIMGNLVSKPDLDKPDELLKKVIESGYQEYVKIHFENAKDRIDDLHELINFAHQYKSLNTFLHDITLRESFKGETFKETGRQEEEQLVLTTIHQAKGLEWNTVFVIGLCEGQFPHAKSLEDAVQLEEERRLFYVAVTRAKNDLYLIHPITRYDYQMGMVITRKSVFIQELDPSVYDRWEIEERSEGPEPIIDLE